MKELTMAGVSDKNKNQNRFHGLILVFLALSVDFKSFQ